MSNTIKVILVAVGVLMIAGIVYQEHRVRQQHSAIGNVRDSLQFNKLTENVLRRQLYQTDSTKQVYEVRIKQLKDSVYILKKRVANLNLQLQTQGQTILENRKKMDSLRLQSEVLLTEIARMRSEKNADASKIATLEQERFNLDKKVGELFMKNDTLEQKIVDETVEKEELKENIKTLSEKEIIFDIQNKVAVKFATVLPTKDDVKKDAKSAKRWKKTLIKLRLDFEDLDLIMNEFFMVQIVDDDSGKIIPPREANAGDDTQGLLFRFKGNPVPQIIYPNYQKKNGKNYSVRLFYVRNDALYSMNKGGKQKISF